MADPIWYFGPDWDLRPLVCPEPDIEMPVVRYGGMFQGLSGARTLRVTGHKQQFKFELRYLDASEFAFLEACHVRAIGGPFRLLNPMKKNLLSYAGSTTKVIPGFNTSGQGVAVNFGTLSSFVDWPTGAPALGNSSVKWIPSGAYARFDPRHMFPVTPGQQVTVSVYIKGSVSTDDAKLWIDWHDKNLIQLSSSSSALTVIGTAWTRFTFTATAPANAYTARMAINSNRNSTYYMAAAQAEYGSVATTWEIGGAAPRVVLDSFDLISPRYPYLHGTLSLLEA